MFLVILIGDSRVGKTSLINKFKKREDFQDVASTIGAEFTNSEPMEVGDEKIVLQIWDTGKI